MTRLTLSQDAEPEIRFWLSRTDNSITLEARHSDDQRDQTLVELTYVDGKLELHTRDIHQTNLLKELGVECGAGIVTSFVNKSAVCPEHG